MNRRLLLLLLIAVVAAGSTVLSLRGWIEGQRADYAAAAQRTQPDTNTDDVLVANSSLPAGLLVKRSHLRWQAWPEDAIAESYIVRNRGVKIIDFEGTVVRTGIANGEPLTIERVVGTAPGVSKKVQKILSDALFAALNDPAIQKWNKKTGRPIDPLKGPATGKLITNLGKFFTQYKEILK